MKVANIVSNSVINVSNQFNVVESMEERIHGLPTLIIGYELINKLYPDFDITDIKVDTDVYWTFKRIERRDKFEEDLEWFKTKVYTDLTSKIKYIFVDLIQYQSKTLSKIFRKIYKLKDKISYIHKDMIYIYGDNLIFGVDLKLLDFMSIDREAIKNKIKGISSVFLEDNKILIEYKKNVELLDNQVKYIPYIYSILNGKNNPASIVHIP